MNDIKRQPAAPPPVEVTAKPKKSALSRIALALLDQYAMQNEGKGGDPYNTTCDTPASDQWRGNARRI